MSVDLQAVSRNLWKEKRPVSRHLHEGKRVGFSRDRCVEEDGGGSIPEFKAAQSLHGA
jgi:hypothetical protein